MNGPASPAGGTGAAGERDAALTFGPDRVELADADATQTFGADLAARLRPGDVVLLTGELGAGKTTLTQGIAAGLGVRGPITSPTFVIARVHPSLGGGPALVHADAYRLGDGAEFDDLDLDASVPDAVTVVEWGRGLAESLSESYLEVEIARAVGGAGAPDDGGAGARAARLRGHGPRWAPASVD